MQVVFHLSTVRADVVRKVFNNIKNLCAEASDAEVHLVVNTDGVTILKQDSQFLEDIEKLNNDGVVFKACSNSIENTSSMKEDELNEEAEVVPSGVNELAKLQNKGFGYIRP